MKHKILLKKHQVMGWGGYIYNFIGAVVRWIYGYCLGLYGINQIFVTPKSRSQTKPIHQ
ncbi:MAG: hypothetical protein JXR65_09695 [Bacteroidales bacterium]|nr:hypothetical protein [Bacteroidales bacterium]